MPPNKTYAIHPAIGIARMGNAAADPTDSSTYYLSPESPYEVPNAGRPYKTGGKIKKQAQRFRIYEYENGVASREITCAESDVESIEWTVQVANRKPALDVSGNGGSVSTPGVQPTGYGPATTRNKDVASRHNLSIDPGPQSVSGFGSRQDMTGSVTFQGVTKEVTLGSLYVEPGTGRLLVFASNGVSEGLADGKWTSTAPITTYANNDNWYDEIADGWVRAKITFKDGTICALDTPEQSAWVIGAVPRFAPSINMYTTLYEVAMDAIQGADDVPTPSFAKDIYPILRSVSLLQWVNSRAATGHGTGRNGYYLAWERMRLVSDNNPAQDSDPYKARQGVFAKIRNPNHPELNNQMPRLPLQCVEDPDHVPPWDIGCVTPRQYAMLEKWRDGDFEPGTDGAGQYTPLEQLSVGQQPDALDYAALQTTAGTPFFPGIESWQIMRQPGVYLTSLPLRISAAVKPGDLSIANALPWQADYLDCIDAWWPVQRPNQVTRDGQPLQNWVPEEWQNVNHDNSYYNKMVQNWWRLGFVIEEDNGALYVETEQEPLG